MPARTGTAQVQHGAGPSVALFGGSPAEWDGFVRAQPGWSYCHCYAWRNVMRDAFGHSAVYLAARVDDRLVGVLPLVRVRSAIFGHFLVSVPFGNYGGPLGDARAVAALVAQASELARDEGVGVLELRSRTPLPVELPVSHRKITVLMDMSEGAEALWKSFDSKVRSQVRRPEKDGITVQTGPEQVEPFFHVFSRHMRDLGTPTYPLAFFRSVLREFADVELAKVEFAVAYHGGRPVACGCGFRWGSGEASEFEITWASALREYNRMSPNMLVYWELMRLNAERGVRTFNFGRCTPGSGTHRFKRQWGRNTRDEQLWWYEQRTDGTMLPREGSATADLGARLWRRLPLPLATLLGPRIVRVLPL